MKLAPRIATSCAVAALLFVVVAPACDTNSEDCGDGERADECKGSFRCEGATNSFFCDRATQVCVQKPGTAMCVTIPGTSPSKCPSKTESLNVAGCQTGPGTTGGNAPKCQGSSEDGITVVCHI